jgi:hypothetical protein
VRRAAIVISADDRVTAAARATDQQAAQEEVTAVRAVEGIAARVTVDLEAQRILPRLDPLPERIIDDAQVPHLDNLPLFTGIGTRDAFASAGIFDIAATIPFEPPDIQSVVEETGAAFGLAPDRGVAPRAAVRTRYTFGIKPLGNRARALAVCKFRKYAADDSGFDGIDVSLASRGGDEIITIGLTARHHALQRPPNLAAPSLLLEIREIELRHCAEQTDMHGGDLADINRDERDARESAAIMEIGDIGELASKPIQCLDDDHVEEAAVEVRQ